MCHLALQFVHVLRQRLAICCFVTVLIFLSQTPRNPAADGQPQLPNIDNNSPIRPKGEWWSGRPSRYSLELRIWTPVSGSLGRLRRLGRGARFLDLPGLTSRDRFHQIQHHRKYKTTRIHLVLTIM